MHYYGLMEADFLASTLSFENADLEINPAVQKSPIFLWTSWAIFLFGQAHLYSHFRTSFYAGTFFEHDAYRLRC
jgi:hypothetical protein